MNTLDAIVARLSKRPKATYDIKALVVLEESYPGAVHRLDMARVLGMDEAKESTYSDEDESKIPDGTVGANMCCLIALGYARRVAPSMYVYIPRR